MGDARRAATATLAPAMETPQALDDPLPVQITGTGQGWLRRYRRYPVFSTPWWRGRWPLVALAWLAALTFSAPLLFEPDPSQRPWAEVIETTLWFGVPALAGPLLGRWVRRSEEHTSELQSH